MADEEREAKRKNLDFRTLVGRFRERGAMEECPICKSDEWDIHHSPGIPGLSIPWGDGSDSYLLSGFLVLLVVCKNCGFIRLHDPTVLGDDIIRDDDK